MCPIGRVTRREQFERLLAVRPRARSAHFAVHHLGESSAGSPGPKPDGPDPMRPGVSDGQLSTGHEQKLSSLVDKTACRIFVGCVVPKRHARRAVTRNLLRRLIRAAFGRHRARLAPGQWVVRLCAAFDRQGFVSADSIGLRRAVASELDALLARVA
jgi:ribonuclease P protein component